MLDSVPGTQLFGTHLLTGWLMNKCTDIQWGKSFRKPVGMEGRIGEGTDIDIVHFLGPVVKQLAGWDPSLGKG